MLTTTTCFLLCALLQSRMTRSSSQSKRPVWPDLLYAIEIKLKLTSLSIVIVVDSWLWTGICGSDVHFYAHGHIGPTYVEKPMVRLELQTLRQRQR